ncbi:MAG: FKBP-type peptidyl-prolyl cis-trans isomerase [Oscillospiraceae bacterium]|nr:FKBP-type peptidyl-prolyl cis-trans isomerase [Oscillospiraceae bacterium]
MKIAVTYDYGEVFQHFGHTEQFKLYEIDDGKLISSEIVGTDGAGHEAVAGFLAEKGVDVVICGGIGEGAAAALAEAGIGLCAGASGNADEAVAAFLLGTLENTGANCDHHDHDHGDGHSCGDHDCGDGCGGCHGCHHGPVIEGKNVGKKCLVHYRGTFSDGTQFDSSYDRGEPLEFICGVGMMIPGFDAAVAVMDVGETRQVHLMPEEAYGEADPNAIFTVETAQLPGSEDLEVGTMVYLQSMYGDQVPARVTAKGEKTVTFDTNHEMAGKELNFTIELTEVLEA